LKLIETELADSWLPRIYRDQILRLRTRAYTFPTIAKGSRIEIHHTLLGIELKAGRRRMLVPDLATARYLSIFARLGVAEVAIPYDITRISSIADDLETSWRRMLLLADQVAPTNNSALRARLRRQLIGKVRAEIIAAGSGTRIPEFKQRTKQRSN
jgi:hypothetical protein